MTSMAWPENETLFIGGTALFGHDRDLVWSALSVHPKCSPTSCPDLPNQKVSLDNYPQLRKVTEPFNEFMESNLSKWDIFCCVATACICRESFHLGINLFLI